MPKAHVEKISKELHVLRMDDDQVRYFEALWRIEEGITYNAYLLVGSEDVILFDTWKAKYASSLLELLRGLIDPRDITHVIVHHVEPDHSGSLTEVLKENGFRAEVHGHPLAGNMLKAFYGIKAKFKPVKDGDKLELRDFNLRFLHTPWLHWPETIMSYLEDQKMLFSGDAFGGFSIPPKLLDDEEEIVSKYLPFVRKYISTIIGGYRDYVLRNVRKIEDQGIEIELIAPAHGLIWRKNPKRIIDYYVKVARGASEEGKVLIIYASMYGSCEEAARIVADELRRNSKNLVVHRFVDVDQASVSWVISDAADSESIVIISPTYEGGVFPTIAHVVNLISRKSPPKPVLVISSHGWAPAAAKLISEALSKAGFKVVDVIGFRGAVSGADAERIRAGARMLLGEKS